MARQICRWVGWLCIALAVVAIGADGVNSLGIGHIRFTTLDAVWYRLSPGTLSLVQAAIERYVWPPLWNPGISAILRLPAFAVTGALGMVLALLCRANNLRHNRFGRR